MCDFIKDILEYVKDILEPDNHFVFYKKILSLISFVLWVVFMVLFFVRKKAIAQVEISKEKLEEYVGIKSFFYQKYCVPNGDDISHLKNGLAKSLRFLYSTWFYVFILTGLSSLIFIFQPSPEKFLKNESDNIDTSRYSIIVETENENSDYEKKKDIVTYKDTLNFRLAMRIETTFIRFDYPIKDSVTVKFIDPLEKPFKRKVVLTSASDTVTIKSLEKSFERKEILTSISDTVPVKFIDSPNKKPFIGYREQEETLTSINEKYYFEFKCRIKREKNPNYKDKGDNEYVNKIVRSHPKDSIRYQKFFDKRELSYCQSEELIKYIIEYTNKIDKEKIKPTQEINLYLTFTTIFSLGANVFLLLFFGFLSAKTNLFQLKEKNTSTYLIFRNFVIGAFVVISLILFLDAIHFPPLRFSESFMFVIYLIAALTSVVAVFGSWGSMNNSYTLFSPWFKLLIFFYAMAQFFELYFSYDDKLFSKYAELVLLIISAVVKVCIIVTLLCRFPKNKRALWYFLSTVNNIRTEEDYDDFVKIFNKRKHYTKFI